MKPGVHGLGQGGVKGILEQHADTAALLAKNLYLVSASSWVHELHAKVLR